MRTMHESKENLSNEQEVKQAIEGTFHVKLNKLPISYRMDFMAFRDNKPTSVIEVKCRKKASSTTYPCFMLALGKWNSGIDYTIKNNIRFFLVGKYLDGIFYYKYKPTDKVDIKWFNGRSDRDDPDDKEPCVYIPMELFKKL